MMSVGEGRALEAPDVMKAFCAKCSGLRKCDIKGQVSDHWDEGGVWGNTYWPAVSGRKRPDWFASMVGGWENSHVLREAMAEMYVALDNDLMRLSAAAIRTAFDIASEIFGIDPNLTFAEK